MTPQDKQTLEALNMVVEPLRNQPRAEVRALAATLKLGLWTKPAGDLLERACIFLDMVEGERANDQSN